MIKIPIHSVLPLYRPTASFLFQWACPYISVHYAPSTVQPPEPHTHPHTHAHTRLRHTSQTHTHSALWPARQLTVSQTLSYVTVDLFMSSGTCVTESCCHTSITSSSPPPCLVQWLVSAAGQYCTEQSFNSNWWLHNNVPFCVCCINRPS